MRHRCLGVGLSALILLTASPAMAQEAAAQGPESTSFLGVVFSSGLLGLLNWAGIFLWGLLALPLGILSVIHTTTTRRTQWPLATKLLVVGAVWVFVLGWVGGAQGTMYAFSTLAQLEAGAMQQQLMAMSLAHALWSVAGALMVCQVYLFFLLISLVILHFKRRRREADEASRRAWVRSPGLPSSNPAT